MKINNILGVGLIATTMCFTTTGCDDDKELTLDAPVSTLVKEIKFEVSEVLPLAVGMDSTLVYSFGPSDADDPTIVFTSSDESVATVDQNGKITALRTGEAIITARTPIGFKVYNAEASVQVNVIPEVIKATAINITNTTDLGEDGVVYVTDELQLKAEILPENHTYSNISWHSTDESVASVDQTGLVKCLSVGKAKIYALAHDHGTARGEFDLDVRPYIPAESLTITPLESSICLSRGPVSLSVSYVPAGATLGSVEWTSSDESVVTVHRGIVTPVGFGEATVMATCLENGKQFTTQVVVESGWLIWDAQNQWDGWITGNYNDQPSEKGDKVWHIGLGSQNADKWRRDIKQSQLPLLLDLKNYPILAVRMTKLPSGARKLDDVNDSGLTRSKELNPGFTDLGDGTGLLIYNIGANYPDNTGLTKFRVFGFKFADILKKDVPEDKAYYDLHWIRTFKTEDEAKAFAESEVANGN